MKMEPARSEPSDKPRRAFPVLGMILSLGWAAALCLAFSNTAPDPIFEAVAVGYLFLWLCLYGRRYVNYREQLKAGRAPLPLRTWKYWAFEPATFILMAILANTPNLLLRGRLQLSTTALEAFARGLADGKISAHRRGDPAPAVGLFHIVNSAVAPDGTVYLETAWLLLSHSGFAFVPEPGKKPSSRIKSWPLAGPWWVWEYSGKGIVPFDS